MGRPALTKEQKYLGRGKIFNAALAVIEDGLKMNVRSVARHCGMSAMSTYTYYQTFGELFDRVADHIEMSDSPTEAQRAWFFANVPIGHPAAQRLIKKDGGVKQ